MKILVNNNGEFLKFLDDKDNIVLEGQFIVPMEGYYECLNEQLFNRTIYSFNEKKWIGVGEKRSIAVQEPTELEVLKNEKEILAKSLYELSSIVEILVKGGVK